MASSFCHVDGVAMQFRLERNVRCRLCSNSCPAGWVGICPCHMSRRRTNPRELVAAPHGTQHTPGPTDTHWWACSLTCPHNTLVRCEWTLVGRMTLGGLYGTQHSED